MSAWRPLWFKRVFHGKGRPSAPARRSVVIAFGALVLLLVGVLVIAFWPRGKIFTLDISTEIVSFQITDPLFSEWDVAGAALWLDVFSDEVTEAALAEGAMLVLNPDVRVELQRHGVGPLRIKLECIDCIIGTIEREDAPSIALRDWAVLKLPLANKPVVLPFRGVLNIGDDVARSVDSILLQGKVSVVEEKLFTRGHYTAGEETLDPGDRVQLWQRNKAGETVPGRLDGFVRAEPEQQFSEPVNALNLLAHGQADYARVERFGSAGYEIRTQAYVRFLNDPVLGVLLAALASLALLLEFFFKIVEFARAVDESTPNE